jgi:beta-lactamase class D
MGYDAGILKNQKSPQWIFQEGYYDAIPIWKSDHNPISWIKNSCVWYSQVLTQVLGVKKFQDYVKKFNYGNQDISGDKDQNNGLTHSWLSSSLEISPEEQVVFLQDLLDGQLPVTPQAHAMTKDILFVEDLAQGWKLYGKTGSGVLLSKDTKTKLKIQHGWFVGWIEKNGRSIVFVNHIVDDKEDETSAGKRAKTDATERLLKFIDEIEKQKM